MTAVSTAKQHNNSARASARGEMSCPHCQTAFDEPVEACPRCNFDLSRCHEAFPFSPPPLSLLLDPSGLLPEGVEREISRTYRKFRKKFPQIDFTFCFLNLQADVDLRDFAFWLHNAAPDADQQRAWRILVVGDLTTGHLTLSPGFALEPFLRSDHLESSLHELAGALSENSWGKGICTFIKECDHSLDRAWRAANSRPRQIDPHPAEKEVVS